MMGLRIFNVGLNEAYPYLGWGYVTANCLHISFSWVARSLQTEFQLHRVPRSDRFMVGEAITKATKTLKK